MAVPAMSSALRLRALLLADHIYRDEGSGKYVIAGTFHQVNVATFPTTLVRAIGIFVSLSGLTGKAALDVELVEVASGDILMRNRSMEVSCDDPDLPVELALEVPPLPLPRAGRYVFRLLVNGAPLGEATVRVRGPEAKG